MTLQLTPRLSQKPVRFPNRIREYRLRAGVSQAELGKAIGKNRKIISLWERGVRFPSGPVLLKLAKSLATLVESLYESIYSAFRPDDPKKPPQA
jgi:transcriptional regulator with XRE-family HTH domain